MKLHIFILLASLLAFTACDKIAENKRLSYVSTISYDKQDSIEIDSTKIVYQRKGVLIEDFTGQNCPNCPDAHAVLEELMELYGKTIVGVSIHAGSFAYPEGQYGAAFQTFKTAESDKYAEPWNLSEYPTGIINRKSGKLGHEEWANYTYNILREENHLNIEIEAELDEENNKIDVTSRLIADKDITGSYQLWITEDSIVSIQKKGTTTIPNYVHNNVFRTSVNGIGGENITLTTNIANTLSHSISKKDNWNAKHLKVVGFVFTSSGVEQVVEVNVAEK